MERASRCSWTLILYNLRFWHQKVTPLSQVIFRRNHSFFNELGINFRRLSCIGTKIKLWKMHHTTLSVHWIFPELNKMYSEKLKLACWVDPRSCFQKSCCLAKSLWYLFWNLQKNTILDVFGRPGKSSWTVCRIFIEGLISTIVFFWKHGLCLLRSHQILKKHKKFHQKTPK